MIGRAESRQRRMMGASFFTIMLRQTLWQLSPGDDSLINFVPIRPPVDSDRADIRIAHEEMAGTPYESTIASFAAQNAELEVEYGVNRK